MMLGLHMQNASPETLKRLQELGWHPDRSVSDDVERWKRELAEFAIFDVAETVLTEFGGLECKEQGPGIEAARSKFSLDPTLALGEGDRFDDFEKEIDRRLYPLGEVDGGHAFLAIADDGRIYAMEQALWHVGDDIWDALDRLMRGRKMPIVVGYPTPERS